MHAILCQRAMKHGMARALGLSRKLGLATATDQLYFAYGANLSEERLRKFNISFERIGTAVLSDYKLNFSMPCEYVGQGYANIEPCKGSSVWGTVFKLNKESLLMLDILEWVPFGFYDRKKVSVLHQGTMLDGVDVYMAKYPKSGLAPSASYLKAILNHARFGAFSNEYIEEISSQKTLGSFELDPGFRLSNPGKRRIFEKSLRSIYLRHDQLREILARKIP
jgi:hypothetical protein